MTYHGNVRVGGPAEVRELAGLMISKLAVGPMDNNAYLLRCRRTDVQLLIDAAAEPGRLLDLIGSDGLESVITTHRHQDHWQGLAQVVEVTGARTVAHPTDAPGISVPAQTLVEDGDSVPLGTTELRVIHLVGHTPGSIALLYDDPDGPPHLFTGDSLFPGGVGKTTPETFPQLIDDVETKLFGRLPDETWVYPGHGRDTTLGAERPHLEEWRARGW